MSRYNFLCANFDGTNFIYAVKSSDSDWYYFEEDDSVIDSHTSIRIHLEDQMRHIQPDVRHDIAITLNSDHLKTYVHNGKFIFNGIELKKCNIQNHFYQHFTRLSRFILSAYSRGTDAWRHGPARRIT